MYCCICIPICLALVSWLVPHHILKREDNMTDQKTHNEDVTEEVKNKNKVFRWLIVICIFLTATVAGLDYALTYQMDLVNIKDKQLYVKDEHIAKIQEMADEAVALMSECTTRSSELMVEYDKLSKRLEGIKDQDDLLRRDIYLYIDKKYKLVPNTLAKDIAFNVVKFSKEYDISPELIVGIIEVESAFNPMAISNKKARGLMQLMPEWAKKFNLQDVTDFHDVDTNIKCGIQVLKIHIKDDGNGNVTKGLYHYVGKSSSYSDKVYMAMGKFVSFRYTVDDGSTTNGDEEENSEEGENVNSNATNERTERGIAGSDSPAIQNKPSKP